MPMLRRTQLADKYGLSRITITRIANEMKAAGYRCFWQSARYLFIDEESFCEWMGRRTRKGGKQND